MAINLTPPRTPAMTTILIHCTARLARALGHPGPFRRGWADHHHVPMDVAPDLLDTLVERTVYEWRTERDYTIYDAPDARCAELYAAHRARQLGIGLVLHVSDLDAETSQCVGHTIIRFGDYVVTELVDETRDKAVAVAWGSVTDAFDAGC